ncbi:DEAD/DEAH box helicase [Prosthecobacter sp.]|uniref:DEAD/DEAH box helicase n=1 Tax=Prosthecobacter sp. TaxID=1965333 RepID=UPI001DC55281|nr:DEAD/DEAH box helicase [Prosthecobacter sp.]MCB1277369.1 DEAD/DEAH box helicase family protein [Prosthecobacter sp.]
MEITEKWLGEIGGWAVMKSARSLVDAGLAAVTSTSDGLIRGTAGSGKMKFTTGLRIRTASDVENLCTCPHARRSGMMCEHALAVALAHVRQQSGARPVAKTGAAPASGAESAKTGATPRRALPMAPLTIPGRYSLYLPETLLQGQVREPFGVFVKYEAGGESESSWFAAWLAGQGIQQPQSLPISLKGESLNLFLLSLAEHPRVFVGKPNGREKALHVAPEQVRLPLVVESVDPQTVRLQLEGKSQLHVLGAWWFCRETITLFRHLAENSALITLAGDLSRGPVTRPLRWLAEQGESLGECFQMELRGEGLGKFHVAPVPCEFEIQLEGSLQVLDAKVSARYGVHHWPVRHAGETHCIFPIQDDANKFVFYAQNGEGESRLLRRLESLGFKSEGQSWRIQGSENILRFYASEMRQLRDWATISEGERWRTVTRGIQRIAPKTKFVPSAGQTGGSDWLSMEFAYESNDGFRLPRAEVLRLVRSGQRSVQGANGKRYILDIAAVDDLEESLRDVPLELTPEGARVHGAHAAYFGDEAAGGRNEIKITDAEVRDEIGDLAGMLRPYQMEGVCWMTSRILQGRGGILADEMGLGKTVQSIALALFLKQRKGAQSGPVLVVCPKSLLGNWQAEFERFASGLKVLQVQGSGREKALGLIKDHDVVLTSYQLVIRDIKHYQGIRFGLILLDEASFIRNPDTDAAKTLRGLQADGRIALTGTPLENGVRDLWSIFQFALPGYLGNQSSFRERFESPIQSGLDLPAGRAAAQRLQKLTLPFFLRRTKRQVLKDLPEKIEQVLWCAPSAAQSEFYRKILEEGREEIKAARRRSGQNGAKMTMFTVLLRLRQVCCDLRLTGVQADALKGLDQEELSGKWPALMGQIESTLESGGKLLVFSQFVQFLRLMREQLKAEKLDHAYLDGSSQDRSAQVERFQKDPNCRIFLISLKAGGYGLNLTAADNVILADPWWNPAVESQAIDRAHRIGQQKVVNAYRLAIRGTVEERILKLQAQKRGLVEAALNDQAPMMEGLTEDDLEELIQ